MGPAVKDMTPFLSSTVLCSNRFEPVFSVIQQKLIKLLPQSIQLLLHNGDEPTIIYAAFSTARVCKGAGS